MTTPVKVELITQSSLIDTYSQALLPALIAFAAVLLSALITASATKANTRLIAREMEFTSQWSNINSTKEILLDLMDLKLLAEENVIKKRDRLSVLIKKMEICILVINEKFDGFNNIEVPAAPNEQDLDELLKQVIEIATAELKLFIGSANNIWGK